jgi:hypothetical protein
VSVKSSLATRSNNSPPSRYSMTNDQKVLHTADYESILYSYF